MNVFESNGFEIFKSSPAWVKNPIKRHRPQVFKNLSELELSVFKYQNSLISLPSPYVVLEKNGSNGKRTYRDTSFLRYASQIIRYKFNISNQLSNNLSKIVIPVMLMKF